jgi:ribosome maturation factor RimP
MDKERTEKTLRELVEPLVRSMGFDFWGLSYAPAGGRGLLRVYIDAEDGVSVDDCAEVSRNLSVMLDVEDPVPGGYNLEVSSPGLEREFFRPSQLAGYEGQDLSVVLREPEDGRKKFTGSLASVSGEAFTILQGGAALTFDWHKVKQVRLVYRFPETGVPASGGKGKAR